MFAGLQSTVRKLAVVFRKSRDTWKARATEKQRRLKALYVKVNDLTRSRDQWKAKAQLLQKQLRHLEAHSRTQSIGTPLAVGTRSGSGVAVSAVPATGELVAPPFCLHHAAKAFRSGSFNSRLPR